MNKSQLFLLVILMQCSATTFAGGPILTDSAGNPVVYRQSDMPIPYSIDQGDMGLFSNSEAAALVDDCFATWQAVATAKISLQNTGFLSVDVTQDNVLKFDNDADGINPIIFDSDGGILDSLYGAGASETIIGFAFSDTDSSGSHYTEGLALLNGRFTRDPYNWSTVRYKASFVHEFGHFIGLDHCQINQQYVGDGSTGNDIYVPTMYPTATDDDTPLGDLNPDDEASLTMLYPASASIVNAAYGKIRGSVRWAIGGPVLGANVVAVKQGDEDMSRFSSVSDYAMQGDGAFEMLVTPGTYSLYIEPVIGSFMAGSSVGPYADTPLSPSFVFPVIKQTYADTVTVAAGGLVENVHFTAYRNIFNAFPGVIAFLLGLLGF